MSTFNAVVEDFPNGFAVLGVSILRDSLGRLGGEECRGGKDMTEDEYCLQGASIITLIQRPEMWGSTVLPNEAVTYGRRDRARGVERLNNRDYCKIVRSSSWKKGMAAHVGIYMLV